jgi:hypothetical protein
MVDAWTYLFEKKKGRRGWVRASAIITAALVIRGCFFK